MNNWLSHTVGLKVAVHVGWIGLCAPQAWSEFDGPVFAKDDEVVAVAEAPLLFRDQIKRHTQPGERFTVLQQHGHRVFVEGRDGDGILIALNLRADALQPTNETFEARIHTCRSLIEARNIPRLQQELTSLNRLAVGYPWRSSIAVLGEEALGHWEEVRRMEKQLQDARAEASRLKRNAEVLREGGALQAGYIDRWRAVRSRVHQQGAGGGEYGPPPPRVTDYSSRPAPGQAQDRRSREQQADEMVLDADQLVRNATKALERARTRLNSTLKSLDQAMARVTKEGFDQDPAIAETPSNPFLEMISRHPALWIALGILLPGLTFLLLVIRRRPVT